VKADAHIATKTTPSAPDFQSMRGVILFVRVRGGARAGAGWGGARAGAGGASALHHARRRGPGGAARKGLARRTDAWAEAWA
jgi:hypothetical protein